jgi:ribose transport system permease protein
MSTLASDRNVELKRDRSPRKDRLLRALRTPGGAVFILLLLLLAAVIAVNPSFGEPGSLIRFIGRTAPIAIAAIGQYFVIVSGEFDLSMGSVVTAQVFIAGTSSARTREGPAGPALMLVFGAFIGLVNGLVTTLLKIPSFIVTLGMMLALLGLVLYWTGGPPPGTLPTRSGRSDAGHQGRSGARDPALPGADPPGGGRRGLLADAPALRPHAGRRRGQRPRRGADRGARVVDPHPRFMLSSLAATVAASSWSATPGCTPRWGRGYEFTAITAVVLGGVVLGGGRGWVLSAARGPSPSRRSSPC